MHGAGKRKRRKNFNDTRKRSHLELDKSENTARGFVVSRGGLEDNNRRYEQGKKGEDL